MDVRWLRSFLRVAETGSISRAAAALNIAQTALSRQIHLLEAETGTQLLARHRRGVLLTEAGQVLCERSRSILAALEAVRLEVSATGGVPSGSIGLGLPTSMLYVLSAELVETYSRRYPKVLLRVHEALGHTVEALLREGTVDAAILISPAPMQGVALEFLVGEEVYLAGPPHCGLSVDRRISAKDLARVPMIMFGRENKVRTMVEQLLARSGLALNPLLEVTGQPLALELIRRGVGYSILPGCAIRAEMAERRISGAPIDGLRIDWMLGVNRASAELPAIRALRELLCSIVRTRVSSGDWGGREPRSFADRRSSSTAAAANRRFSAKSGR